MTAETRVYPMLPFEDRERLLARMATKIVVTDTGCWEWIGTRTTHGYGRISLDGIGWSAHRMMYHLLVEPPSVDLDIDHLCRNTSCVNPAHLEPVTTRTNLVRGATVIARQIAQTHCIHGHPLSGDNLYVRPSGRRQCRACAAGQARRYYRRGALSDSRREPVGVSCGPEGAS